MGLFRFWLWQWSVGVHCNCKYSSGSSPVATNQTQSNDLNTQIDLSAVLGDDAGFERQGVVQ